MGEMRIGGRRARHGVTSREPDIGCLLYDVHLALKKTRCELFFKRSVPMVKIVSDLGVGKKFINLY